MDLPSLDIEYNNSTRHAVEGGLLLRPTAVVTIDTALISCRNDLETSENSLLV